MSKELAIKWPKFLPKKNVERTLSFFKDLLLITEDIEASDGSREEGKQYEVLSGEELVRLLFSENLQCYVETVQSMPLLEELKGLAKQVFSSDLGQVIALQFENSKRSTRWIISSKSYGQAAPTRDWLVELRGSMKHAGVGTPNTAGAMGQALMKKAWKETYGNDWYLHRHYRPNRPDSRWLTNTRIGARSDVEDTDKQYEAIFEVDKKNAYASAACLLPSGPTYGIMYGIVDGMKMYYVECVVEIHEPLDLGPFPVRKLGMEENIYPREPGIYQTTLWHNEVENTRSTKKCTVHLGDGLGWMETTTDMACWVDLVSKLRETAPNDFIKDIIKRAIVAGLGRFGMSDVLYRLISEEERIEKGGLESDTLVEGDYGVVYDWWRRKTIDPHPQTMPHWYSWVLACLRGWMYEEALPYAQKKQLVAINTDAFFVEGDADVEQYRKVAEEVATGDFRIKSYREMRTPHLRHFIGVTEDGEPYRREPGVKKKKERRE